MRNGTCRRGLASHFLTERGNAAARRRAATASLSDQRRRQHNRSTDHESSNKLFHFSTFPLSTFPLQLYSCGWKRFTPSPFITLNFWMRLPVQTSPVYRLPSESIAI